MTFCIDLHPARYILHLSIYSYGRRLVCVGKFCIQSIPTHPASTEFAVPAPQLVSCISRYSVSNWLRPPFSFVWVVVVALPLCALNAEMPLFSTLLLQTHKAYCKCETPIPQSHCCYSWCCSDTYLVPRAWDLQSGFMCTCHSLSKSRV